MELPRVEKFSFATNTIEKLSPGTYSVEWCLIKAYLCYI